MRSFAKINLYLRITGKRPDGYHVLDSLFAFCDLYDEVKIVESDESRVEISGPFAELVDPENNTVLDAINILRYTYGVRENVKVSLVKNIPVGAGLGGGSANAASILWALNDLWELNISQDELAKIGLKLGADVPVCLQKKSAYVSGIGEKIEDTSVPAIDILLVNPNKILSTKHVFAQGMAGFSDVVSDKKSLNNQNELVSFLKNQKNDLEAAAISVVPEINEILQELGGSAGCLVSRMSGSGATCFAIFKNSDLLKKAKKSILKNRPNWWVKTTSLHHSPFAS